MELALLQQIGLGIMGGVVVVAGFYGLLSLKLYRLQFAVGALKESLLSLQNKEKAVTRHKREQSIEEEFRNMKPLEPDPKPSKYANDPVGF